jgi:hypothetical protein
MLLVVISLSRPCRIERIHARGRFRDMSPNVMTAGETESGSLPTMSSDLWQTRRRNQRTDRFVLFFSVLRIPLAHRGCDARYLIAVASS